MSRTKSLGYYILSRINDAIAIDKPLEEKGLSLYNILLFSFEELVRTEKIQLTSLFTKMAYIGNLCKIPKATIYHLQKFRRSNEEGQKQWSEQQLNQVTICLRMTICQACKLKVSQEWTDEYKRLIKKIDRSDQIAFYPILEILIHKIETNDKLIYAYGNEAPFEEIKISYDVMSLNEHYTSMINQLDDLNVLPISAIIHQVKLTNEGLYMPSIFIFEPSFLIDVTSISNCFHAYGSESAEAVSKKFLAVQSNANIMRGNIANFLLDELVSNPDLSFEDVKTKIFQLNPLSLSLLDDKTVVDLVKTVEVHFKRIQKIVRMEFLQNKITKDKIYIEPAFYAPQYGIQGRLDLLHYNQKEKKAEIIELKGSKPFMPNKYGLNNNHYIQTLLYDLLVHAVLGFHLNINNFILYSGADKDQLRYAPKIAVQQHEAIKVRNELFLQQLYLENGRHDSTLFENIKAQNFKKLKGFAKKDIQHFEKVYQSLNEIEKKYFAQYSAFIAVEQHRSKIGQQKSDRVSGLASLWKNSINEKKEAFAILNHLEIKENNTDQEIPLMIFSTSDQTAELSNFRVGDIAVLYPDHDGRKDGAIRSQIFKVNIIEITDQTIVVRFRSRQHNFTIFSQNKFWHIEHDHLDNGFNAMYQSLFEFIEAPKKTKDLWLTTRAPETYSTLDLPLVEEFTEEQQEIFDEIISAKDYYLLWGPPGTGKTSFIVRHVVRYLYEETDEQILLLAYTNRAVDEICEAITAIHTAYKNRFIRIGSRYGSHEKFQDNLLVKISEHIQRRKQLVDRIQNCRIFVGTVASVRGKGELFILKKFDRVIIDEASQLLEPGILGILSRFEKSILIGDHLQLPSVVQQSEEETKVQDPVLNEIGLQNLSNSLFERIYKKCSSENWYWAIGQLTSQGRMHDEIMSFPNHHFYQNKLTCLPKLAKLKAPISLKKPPDCDEIFTSQRLVYVPSEINLKGQTWKTNEHEAKIIAAIISQYLSIFKANQIEITSDKLGVITPYRAQIALIRSTLVKKGIDPDLFTIDTVERYQGGARDVIIFSFCLNHALQLDRMSSISEDGIDRKLNVALTRAREQMIIIGNEALLEQHRLYNKLKSEYHKFQSNIMEVS